MELSEKFGKTLVLRSSFYEPGCFGQSGNGGRSLIAPTGGERRAADDRPYPVACCPLPVALSGRAGGSPCGLEPPLQAGLMPDACCLFPVACSLLPEKTVDNRRHGLYNRWVNALRKRDRPGNGSERGRVRAPAFSTGQPLPSGPRGAGRALPLQSPETKLGWYRDHFAPEQG